MRPLLIIILSIFCGQLEAQTLGGSTVFNFLKLPASPQLSALGGINVSAISDDAGLAFHNPSLLSANMNGQMQVAFQGMVGDIRQLHMVTAYRHEKLSTNFAFGINYIHYGTLTSADDAGNQLGDFRPQDYVVQLSASREYSASVTYGLTLKYIHSRYGIYHALGIAMDAALSYHDSSGLQASLVLKNMGMQLDPYQGTEAGDLPFDIQLGITKKLKNAPLQFSLTAQQMHRFDILYNDSLFNRDNGQAQKSSTAAKLARHLVFGVQVFPSKNLEVSVGYNVLRRAEMNMTALANGLNGFSFGGGFHFKKIAFRYARAYYQPGKASNHVGLNIPLLEYF